MAKQRRSMSRDERASLKTAATILGLPLRTVQHLAARGEIAGAAKFGRRWTFDVDKLRRLIKERERQTWLNARHRPDAFGGGTPFGGKQWFAGDANNGRLTQMIQKSQKRVAALAKNEH
jgi:Helix-turn-helix domain